MVIIASLLFVVHSESPEQSMVREFKWKAFGEELEDLLGPKNTK